VRFNYLGFCPALADRGRGAGISWEEGMKVQALDEAYLQAKRFLALADKVSIATSTDPRKHRYIESGPKETGALRRASMDLTRALAEMRKP
jgi:hypothetical protein